MKTICTTVLSFVFFFFFFSWTTSSFGQTVTATVVEIDHEQLGVNSDYTAILRADTQADRTTLRVIMGDEESSEFEIGYAHFQTGSWVSNFKLDGSGSLFIAGGAGIGTATPRGLFDVDGPGDIFLCDELNSGTVQSLFIPGHVYLSPYNGGNISYLQARRYDNSGTTSLRLRTYNNGILTEAMHLEGNGNVGIGTTTSNEKLTVLGTIYGKEVKVDLSVPGPDYVFMDDYDLLPLEMLEKYAKKNSHLPEVPTAQQMESDGINVGEMNMLLLKKIEELTLYLIEQNNEIRQLKTKINEMQTKKID